MDNMKKSMSIPCYVFVPGIKDQQEIKEWANDWGFSIQLFTPSTAKSFPYVLCNEYGSVFNQNSGAARHKERVDCENNIDLFKHLCLAYVNRKK